MYWIDKVIEELKGRSWSKFNIDWIEDMLKAYKNKPPMSEEGMTVVEIEAEPIKEDGEAEAPELPTASEEEVCPECGIAHEGACEKPEESEEEKEESDKASAEWMEAISDTKETMEDITPAEQDKMDEILKAIKTFFPDENTEDVLVRIVSRLIDR